MVDGKKSNDPQSGPDDPRLSKIIELLASQQEHHVKVEKAQAEAAAELKLQQISAVRDGHADTISRLENLLLQQREDQARINAEWNAERNVLAEKLAAQEKEAKEAAAQAEKARDEADLRGQEEKRKAGPQAIRRTRIKDGIRSFEVAEYASDRLEPLINIPTSSSWFFDEELFGMDSSSTTEYGDRRYDSFVNSTGSWAAKRSAENSREAHKIVFPPKTDRTSPKTLKLQASLAASGIEAVFDDPNNAGRDISIRSTHKNLPRSTIFWEPPTLSLGSELLYTMKRAGWKPLYIRSSGKLALRLCWRRRTKGI
jgi:hypothetical protein